MTELDRFHDRLVSQLRAAAPEPIGAPAARAPARRALGVLALATVAAAAVALFAGMSGRGPSVAPASAAAILTTTARAAGTSGEAPLRPGQYRYQRYRFQWRLGLAPVPDGIAEEWVASDGTGRRLIHGSGGRTTTERFRPGARPFTVGAVHLSYTQLQRLGNGTALARVLDRTARAMAPEISWARPEQRRALVTYEVLRDALLAPTPPAVDATLLRRLATTPGLTASQLAPGRTRVALVVGDVQLALDVEPASGGILALQRRLLRRSSQVPGPPRIVNRAEFLARAVVDGLGRRP